MEVPTILIMVGLVSYALPNFYPADPQCKFLAQALQWYWMNLSYSGEKALKDADIDVKSVELEDNSLLIRLNRADQQQYSKSIVKDLLGDDYVVAINLAQTTPEWLTSIEAHPMKLGLTFPVGTSG